MNLTTVWFLLIAALWTGYFVLEGFDFGVGILLPVIARDERERRVLINTIGPVWDGNEVWAITAIGATFAAFPPWYATLLSGFYLPMLAILTALIVRGVAFEYRGKHPPGHAAATRWKARWDTAIILGSTTPALLWGVIFANQLRGVPMNTAHDYTGGLTTLLNPYALLGGLTTLGLFASHGAVFLALKTTGQVRARAGALAPPLTAATTALTAAFLTWTLTLRATPAAIALATAATTTLAAAARAAQARREGWAFTGTAAAIALTVATLFAAPHPDVLPASTQPGNSLTISNAAASPYTLTVLTWATAFIAPVVLLYQGWTYWVFRRRIGTHDIPDR